MTSFPILVALLVSQAPAGAPVETKPESQVHLHAGLSAGLGVFFPGPAICIGPSARIGAQINDMWGAYFNVSSIGGLGFFGGSTGTGGTGGITTASYLTFSALGELTLGNSFFVALGPTLANASWSRTSVTAGTTGGGIGVEVVAGWMPGALARVGFGFGPRKSGTTSGQFIVSIDTQVLFGSQKVSLSEMGGTTGGSISAGVSSQISPAVSPMLMFGYEWK